MIAVIVPTVNRADMLEALVANIHQATLNDHQIYLVMEVTDHATQEASKALDVQRVVGTYGSCSVAVNAGYRASTEPFVAVVNDDCYFHANWDAHALQYFTDSIHIVGMNDGHGDCKCFPMVRRAFIEEHSGVFDKPNTIFHTYKSQGPDTEFAFYAQLRGVWADAPYSIVEHRNWRAGADPNHPNYLKARDTITDDLAEYNRRWPLWDPDQRMPPGVPTVEAR
jgi:glycosyltransferase involved in cell wall biosynthesis